MVWGDEQSVNMSEIQLERHRDLLLEYLQSVIHLGTLFKTNGGIIEKIQAGKAKGNKALYAWHGKSF